MNVLLTCFLHAKSLQARARVTEAPNTANSNAVLPCDVKSFLRSTETHHQKQVEVRIHDDACEKEVPQKDGTLPYSI